MPDIQALAVAKLSPLYMSQLAASGDSKVSAELIAALPALEVIPVMGVGYDGVAVDAAQARGIVVTHTPDVLNDDVADLAFANLREHFGIRPTDLVLATQGIAAPGVVVEPTGAETERLVQVGKQRLTVVMHGRTDAPSGARHG